MRNESNGVQRRARVLVAGRMAAGATVLALALAAAGGAAGASEVRADGPQARASSYLGVQVPLAEAPWAATLVPLDARKRPVRGSSDPVLRCSAAVIGERRVLIASHCLQDIDVGHFGVRVGTDNVLANPGRVVPIARAWAVWELGDRGRPATDLALVETTRPLGVPALALADARPQVGERVSSFGFGDDRQPAHPTDLPRPFLRRLDSTVADCSGPINASAICTTTTDGSGTRPGDSGGPVVVVRNGVPAAAGVTYGGAGGAGFNIYSDATAQRDFIASPPDAAQVLATKRYVRISGDVRPGGRVTCDVEFTPKPKRVTYAWHFGRRPNRNNSGPYFDHNGLRARYLHAYPDATRRSIVLPPDAGGKRLQCAAAATRGGHSRDVVVAAVIPRIRRGAKR